MSDPYLLLWLEAPLQSWGHDSKFGRRDSLDFPTKSGLLGLICCAMGAGGKQTEFLERWADRDIQIEAYVLADRKGAPLPRQPLMRDFHMVGSGYDDSDPWQSLLIPKTSDGKKAVGGGSKMTYRYYLEDMAFAVALQGPNEDLEAVESALRNPVWDLYLGRKNCVPTEFIAQGVHSDADEAMQHAQDLAKTKNRLPVFRVMQGEHREKFLRLMTCRCSLVPISFIATGG